MEGIPCVMDFCAMFSIQGHIARLHCIQLHSQKITKVIQRIKRTMVIIAVRVQCTYVCLLTVISVAQFTSNK